MEKKKKIPKWAIVIAVILVIGVVGALIEPEETSNDFSPTEQENISDNTQEGNYMTFLEWTNSGNDNSDEVAEWLKISIENDNYDGDILQAGTYIVEQTDGEYDGTPQRIYNLYVTDLDTENPDDVQNNSLPITVGGVNGYNTEITLEKGQYLYIQKISGGETGHLKLEIK